MTIVSFLSTKSQIEKLSSIDVPLGYLVSYLLTYYPFLYYITMVHIAANLPFSGESVAVCHIGLFTLYSNYYVN